MKNEKEKLPGFTITIFKEFGGAELLEKSIQMNCSEANRGNSTICK
jgi:hypothetical protein